jgi:hypothetical protein
MTEMVGNNNIDDTASLNKLLEEVEGKLCLPLRLELE